MRDLRRMSTTLRGGAPRSNRSRSVSPSSSSLTRNGVPRCCDVVDRQQIGMIEHPGGARFLLEALQPLLVAECDGGQDLDRDTASEADCRSRCRLRHTPFPIRPVTRYGPSIAPGGARAW